MCGIAGYLGPKKITPQIIENTLHLMKRRGPDNQQSIRFLNKQRGHIDLLHSRLSIIDLDNRADQPFSYNNKTISLRA